MKPAGPGGSWRGRLIALTFMLVAAAAGCTRGNAAVHGRIVQVRERDFALTPNVERVPAGLLTFRVHNAGPSTHEFLIDRTSDAADALPLGTNGMTVNEDSPALIPIASLNAIRLGQTRDLTVRLAPGRYVLFCNLEGHYRGGMYAAIEVVA